MKVGRACARYARTRCLRSSRLTLPQPRSAMGTWSSGGTPSRAPAFSRIAPLATAAAILQLRDAGKLSLDDEIMAAASALLPKPTWRSSSRRTANPNRSQGYRECRGRRATSARARRGRSRATRPCSPAHIRVLGARRRRKSRSRRWRRGGPAAVGRELDVPPKRRAGDAPQEREQWSSTELRFDTAGGHFILKRLRL